MLIRLWMIGLLVLTGTVSGYGQLFESDSKQAGTGKMDIVIKEVERRERSSVLTVTITTVGSSVGASFFLLCSVRQLALERGPYQYVAKVEDIPKRGQMLVGFLRSKEESLASVDHRFPANDPHLAIIDLDPFSQICDASKKGAAK